MIMDFLCYTVSVYVFYPTQNSGEKQDCSAIMKWITLFKT